MALISILAFFSFCNYLQKNFSVWVYRNVLPYILETLEQANQKQDILNKIYIYIYFIAKDVYKIKRNVVAMHTYTFTALTSFRLHCEMKLASKRVTIRLSDKSLGICISYDSSRGNDKSVWYGDYADGIGGQCSGTKVQGTCIQRYLPLGLQTNIVLRDSIVGHARETRYKFATVVAMVGTMHSLMKDMFSRNIGRWKKEERKREKENKHTQLSIQIESRIFLFFPLFFFFFFFAIAACMIQFTTTIQ